MSKPAFQPAPRPRPRLTPEAASEVAAATEDLGFGRASSAPVPEARPAKPVPPTKGQEPKRELAQDASIKLTVPASVGKQLRQRALDRGVTVRYLILEALAAQGVDIDLASIPEDGRRIR